MLQNLHAWMPAMCACLKKPELKLMSQRVRYPAELTVADCTNWRSACLIKILLQAGRVGAKPRV